MRVLLVHPEDSPRFGPWSKENWDLILDLGQSSRDSQAAWTIQFKCSVVALDSFRHGVKDAKIVRQIFAAGRGHIVDEEGVDWWDLTSLLIAPEAMEALALLRLAAQINRTADLWSTRADWRTRAFEKLLSRPVRIFGHGPHARLASKTCHYASLLRRFSPAQIREILLDKYDSGFQWRARFNSKPEQCHDAVVLLPSAYTNVSRMAAQYAQMLPEQTFLLVATRQSAKQFARPKNVVVHDLAAYREVDRRSSEVPSLLERWASLRKDLCRFKEMDLLSGAGVFNPFEKYIRNGVAARDAWRKVIEYQPVRGILCGDDSNVYTRLPVLLGATRNIPTADFHHGAFDGRYLLKDLPCDVYFAKNEMELDYLSRVCGLPAERIQIAPPATSIQKVARNTETQSQSIVWFSEPFEAAGLRPEDVYRELLPPLLRLACLHRRNVIIKLHPFENPSQRRRLVREVIGPGDSKLVRIVAGPLTPDLLSQTWFGVTVESTTVVDCYRAGVCCFICGWISLSQFGYREQFERFGVGHILQSANEIAGIPERLPNFKSSSSSGLFPEADSLPLRQWLTGDVREVALGKAEP